MLNAEAVAMLPRECDIVTLARGQRFIVRLLSLLAIAMAAMSIGAAPAAAQSATGEARSIVVRPLSLVKTDDLDFGYITPGATAGTVVINANTDARTITGGVQPLGGAPLAARYVTYGGPRQFLIVSRGPLPVLNRVGGGASMNVLALTLNGPAIRYLPNEGLIDLRVGGTLEVGANQAEGSYVGQYTITVTYF